MIMCKKIRISRQILLAASLIVLALLGGCVDKAPKIYRVGILSGTDAFLGIADGFKAKMTELGYIEGKNIVYDLQKVNADPAGEQRIAKKFVADKVDLIFTFPTEPTLAVKAATQGTNLPVVFAYAGIEGIPLVKSVREPGGNMTGIRFPGPEQMSKRLELLHRLVPKAKRVWIGYDKNYPNTAPALAVLRPDALSLGITLVEVPCTTLEDLKIDLAKRAKAAGAGIDAIILMPDILNHSPVGWAEISKFASKHGLPIGGSFPYTVEQGAIFGNANDMVKVGELAAPLADKIFKGISAGTIPVVTPEQNLWLNYKRAKELGLTVPDDLMNQADKIIR